MIDETEIRLSRRHCWMNRSAMDDEEKKNVLYQSASRGVLTCSH
jgi:hypothetical protein